MTIGTTGREPPRHRPARFHHRLASFVSFGRCGKGAQRHFIVTTHSPFFVDPLGMEEVRVLYRDVQGYTRAKRVADMPGVREFMQEGASLGDLWMEGHFDVGDPLAMGGEE